MYLKLYDDSMPERRAPFASFMGSVVRAFEDRQIDVTAADVCRVQGEFAAAMRDFEGADVDCVVTVHLAYSPSLESIDALSGTELPLVILDTTMDHDFGLDVDPARLMWNHGIHGVMDLACMLRRRGKPFQVVAGHIAESDVMGRAAGMARAAYAARCLRSTRVLRIGAAFRGMGDFSVEEDVLAGVLGITVDQRDTPELAAAVGGVSDPEVEEEIARDREAFECDAPGDVHARSVRVGLGLRRMLADGKFSAFSMNFLAFDQPSGPTSVVPFLEASKAMARGIGYAGEGDVLTASFVGALAQGFGDATFTEIFCPDWKGNSLFLSHMGEINPAMVAAPVLIEKPFPYTPALNPAVVTGAIRPGPATYANLAPGPDDTFRLIAAPVEVLGDGTHQDTQQAIRGWVRPACPVEEFLEEYARLGGTHHSALILGNHVETLAALAGFLGIESAVVK